ncbi:MAG: UDP-N-acetylmuramoyl-L-alanine--D-glutamate ligase [Anaerolineae bacterium]
MATQVNGRHVIVIGLARQGAAAARWLAENGARVTVTDARGADALRDGIAALAGLPVTYALGAHPPALLDDADLLCLSGGVPLDMPLVAEARARGLPLTNDAQLFLERCPARVVGVTGSAGKTTTTTLVGAMCAQAGLRTWVGGNIGHVLIGELARIAPDDLVVMELSSFQLELMTASPQVAAVLNITPNHLDRHGTMAAYTAAKAHILRHQGAGDIAVLGRDDPGARALAGDARGHVWWFSAEAPATPGAYLEADGRLVLARPDGPPEAVCARGDIRLRGRHNLYNVLAACAIAGAAGVPAEAMREAIAAFEGVAHRLEPVATVRGVLWVNDSIATAPERVMAALRSFDAPIVLLAGGRDKKLPWEDFAALAVRKVRHLIAFGEAGAMIAGHVRRAWEADRGPKPPVGDGLEAVDVVPDLEAAVRRAAEAARPGEVVLLSPGGTSFDAYADFVARGAHFRELVGKLTEAVQIAQSSE